MSEYAESQIGLVQPYGGISLASVQDESGKHLQKVAMRNGIASVTGLLASAGATVQADCADVATVMVGFSGTFSGTFIFEGSINGSIWYPVTGWRMDNLLPYNTTGAITASYAYQCDVSGFSLFRVRQSVYTSGSATIHLGFSVAPSDKIVNQAAYFGTTPVSLTSRLPVATDFNSLCVNADGAAGAALTLTLPAVTSQYHYIDLLEINLYSTAARTGNATPIIVTSTNLIGSPTYMFPTAAAIGQIDRNPIQNSSRVRSSAVSTATTIVMPAVVGGLWSAKCFYTTSTGL